ncbi:cation:proton antiporter [uncultured Methanomethylovorans sp.]|uniref:cation:proton antiporter domain-containing protein n=1 Tax=uncultured Methanomethylovorans sp. TaxID=183759 RepID=UPI002AA64BD3|nr:cation:proton antiporter [uncultured Methanomethylovorans sp.]
MAKNLANNLAHPLSLMFLQIAIIVLMARLFGFLFHKIGQPSVIGEMTAGIILGPSVLGMFWPQLSNFLFSPASLGWLETLSNLGLVLFVFIIGLELDSNLLKNKAQTALVVSHASIVAPFFLGVCLAYFLYNGFAPEGVSFLSFSLFMGIAMSLTAFPVLARIIQERKLTQSSLGTLALTCAAADDVTAWCLLAAVVSIIRAETIMTFIATVVLSILYILFMLYFVRPLLQRLGDKYVIKGNVSKGFITMLFVVLFLSAFATETIGIHALFGAFLAGIIMPVQTDFRLAFISRIEDVSLVILLPLFFAINGLKTQLGLLNAGHLWVICGLIILVAVMGKFGGSAAAARFTGQSWANSLALGALMNTRGLIELVILSIGYDLGILTPTIFTMMVLMALVTTFMTRPMLWVIEHFFPNADLNVAENEV